MDKSSRATRKKAYVCGSHPCLGGVGIGGHTGIPAKGFPSGPDSLHRGFGFPQLVGQQTILNYPTTAIQPRIGGSVRMTRWPAPDLGCFALRITTEEKRTDGSFRLVQEKRALSVNLNP